MKNLLNNIPQEEKNRILEMHRVVKEQSVIGAPNRGMIDTGRDGGNQPINPSDYGMGKYSMTNLGKPSGVKAVQQALIDKGYNVGKSGADGKLGENTKKAIIKYQKDNGIKQTGVVGPITAKSLGVQPLTSTTQNKDKESVPLKSKNNKGIDMFLDCVKNSPKKQITKLKNGSESLLIDGYYFYKNNRVMMPNRKMGEYFCYDNGVKIKDSEGNKTFLDTGVETKHDETSIFSGGIKGFLRKSFPNVAQIFMTRPLTGQDFTESQKQVVYGVIQNAIKQRKQDPKKACTEYIDYSPEIDEELNRDGGATTSEMMLGSASSDEFRVATLLGRFCYELKSNGSYTVRDDYDFHKWKDFTVKPSEVEGMSYPEKIGYIMHKTGLSPYGAIRHIGWMEHPNDAPASTKTRIVLDIDTGYYASLLNKNKPTDNEVT